MHHLHSFILLTISQDSSSAQNRYKVCIKWHKTTLQSPVYSLTMLLLLWRQKEGTQNSRNHKTVMAVQGISSTHPKILVHSTCFGTNTRVKIHSKRYERLLQNPMLFATNIMLTAFTFLPPLYCIILASRDQQQTRSVNRWSLLENIRMMFLEMI